MSVYVSVALICQFMSVYQYVSLCQCIINMSVYVSVALVCQFMSV